MVTVDLLHPAELDSADAHAWSRLQTSHPAFSSPLLSPQFAKAVGAVRGDARLAVWRQGGRATGFLAFHRRPGAFARPIGAPFSDLHGVVSAPGARLAPGRLLEAAGVRALKTNALIDPYDLLSAGPQAEASSGRIVMDGNGADYLDRVRAASRNLGKNIRRYSHKLARDLGEVRLAAPDRSQAAFEALLAWKSAQLRTTGLHDYLAAGWTRQLMQRLFETAEDGFEGVLISLMAGDRCVAGQFGVRLDGHYHPWISAMDPALKAYSPGGVLQWKAIEAMPALGLHTYELGDGAGGWKKHFALSALPVRTGLAIAAGPHGALAGARERFYDWPARQAPTLGRLRRRLDHIAATELSMAGRTRGVIHALASFDRRNAARQGQPA